MSKLIDTFKREASKANMWPTLLAYKWIENAQESSQISEQEAIDLLLQEKFKTL